MRKGDSQIGTPQVPYKDTKANIEALTGIPQGAIVYATDTDELGTYDGAAWNWGGGGGFVWGTGTGTLSDQADLQAELDGKLDDSQIEDAINNGEVNKAPTENAVFDALTGKETAGAAATAEANAKAYADGLVVGLWDDRGSFDASGGAYPSSGGSGTAGAILKGDIWTISVAGTLPTGQVVEVGDVVRALVDTPGNTQANWAIVQQNIGYVAENSANKTSTITGNEASTTLYSTIKGIVDWAKQGLTGVLSSKTTPVDADSVLINDSADSNKTKLTTWANIKATLKAYFDTLYAAVANGVTNGDSHDHVGGDGAAINVEIPLIAHGNSGTIPASTTYFLAPPFTALSNTGLAALITTAGTIRNFYLRLASAQPASGNLVCTATVNGVDTAITFTIAAGSGIGNYSDTSNSVAISAGDRVGFKLVNNATGASGQIGAMALGLKIANS